MKEQLKVTYNHKIGVLSSEIKKLSNRSKWSVAGELSAVILLILCIVAYFKWLPYWWLWILVLAFAIVYLLIRKKDSENCSLADQKENIKTVYERELAYLDGDYSSFHNGEQYVNPQHEFSLDLDIFGPESLFNRMNRTITTGGGDYLASELSHTEIRTIPEIEKRRQAINELSKEEDLRAEFISQRGVKPVDTKQILSTLHEVQQMNIQHFSSSRLSLIIILLLLISFYILIILAILGIMDIQIPLLFGFVQSVIVIALCSKPIKQISLATKRIRGVMSTYSKLIGLIIKCENSSKEINAIVRCLSSEQSNALLAFRKLSDVTSDLGQRNEFWTIISNYLYLGDYFIVHRFLNWQGKYLGRMEEWIDAVSRFDALVSMSTFVYNEPEAIEPEIVSDEFVYKASGIYHPFLGEKAIRNNFQLIDSNYYIITGANMAGKSTFLRSIGINYVLAMCGLPVFAERLQVSVFSLFSSMRTTDDLAHGISYFNAELLRLKQVIETCKCNNKTLIILDEILKGTNSLDKLNGSRLFLESISSLPVTGIIATHDLELSKMEQTYPERFHNYCFEIQLTEKITYSYKITKGVAQNQNATFLLKNILKDSL